MHHLSEVEFYRDTCFKNMYINGNCVFTYLYFSINPIFCKYLRTDHEKYFAISSHIQVVTL